MADNKLLVTLTPEEIDIALKKSLNHPFVSKRFESGGATGIRLRIGGDRLHWDTEELQKFHKTVKGIPASQNELRYWAEIIIDAKQPRYTSIYFNTNTGELIYEDTSIWPYKQLLLQETASE